MGRISERREKQRLAPDASALAPTSIAIGTITNCAATMQADIRLVPAVLVRKRELLADQRQHRRIGEVEQDHASGEDQQGSAGEKHGESGRRSAFSFLALPRRSWRPRARSWSIARPGIAVMLTRLAIDIAASR